MSASSKTLAIILAAGQGTRMRSQTPKVLHRIAGRPMLGHVLSAVQQAGIEDVAVIVGPDAKETRAYLKNAAPKAKAYEQRERLGTAHAVLAAREAIEAFTGDHILVLFGDTPLLRADVLTLITDRLDQGADLVVTGFHTDVPGGYGRFVMDGDKLTAIREAKDASPEELAITFCNGGLKGFRSTHCLDLLDRIDDQNAQGEFYLTDAVELANRAGLSVTPVAVDEDELLGVNDRAQLANATNLFQNRKRQEVMLSGVTLEAPETVFFSADTVIQPDVTIEPNVVFAPGVTVRTGAQIRAFSHLEGATVGQGAIVGPYARLRPGTKVGEDAKIGNFVETKAATIEKGAKVNHLTYIGDARIGAGANIGAGTITCNYDGTSKYFTDIGQGAFIGSNSSLVAPVSIGDGAFVGSGSVVTEDVPDNALALARERQVTKANWATTFKNKRKN